MEIGDRRLLILCVFVSSTWLDLQPERAAVEKALQRLGETKFTGMEYFGSRAESHHRYLRQSRRPGGQGHGKRTPAPPQVRVSG